MILLWVIAACDAADLSIKKIYQNIFAKSKFSKMADYSSMNVENVEKKFPYRILNDLNQKQELQIWNVLQSSPPSI